MEWDGRRTGSRLGVGGAVGLTLVISAVLGASGGAAQPLPREDVPPELRSWIPWVLDGEATYGCTWVGGEPQCVWPGQLRLRVDGKGGAFEQAVVTDRTAVLQLPGDRSHWPHDVSVDGSTWPVLGEPAAGGEWRPYVRLPAGEHRIEGSFRWNDMPEVLALPRAVARVALTIEGNEVKVPRRNEEGKLWLRGRGAQLGEGQVNLQVYRRIDDAVPVQVTTLIVVRASGRSREVDLGTALLPGSVPTRIESGLAVRLSPEGRLITQVYAGSFEIRVTAVFAAPPTGLSPPQPSPPWPEEEVWVWAADESLRQVELAGAPSVDPARTDLPEEWKKLPAFVLDPKRNLQFRTSRRGEPNPPPNRVTLAREVWLDLGGEGYTVRDRISGDMYQGWRLDLLEGELGHVVLDGQDQLITQGKGASGVELRRGKLDVVAESRLARGGVELPAVGWSEDVRELSTTLHLPPGWSLLAVRGADEAPNTWIELWDLWGIFFVLVMSLALGRLLGYRWGAVTFLTLTLSYHESGAPLFAWVALVILLAILRVLPKGFLRTGVTGMWWLSAIVLILIAVPFATDQIREGLFPGTKRSEDSSSWAFGASAPAELAEEVASPEPEPTAPAAGAPPSAMEQELDDEGSPALGQLAQSGRGADEYKKAAPRADSSVRPQQWSRGEPSSAAKSLYRKRSVDPNAVIQTGPGVPDWNFRRWNFSWSGPVDKTHRLGVYLLSPGWNRLLAFLRVALLGLLLFALFRHRPRRSPDGGPPHRRRERGRRSSRLSVSSAAGLFLSGVGLWCAPSVVHAQSASPPAGVEGSGSFDHPSDQRLEELRTRLTRAPECVPRCVVASELALRVTGDRVVLDTVVHAESQAAYRIPGPAENWVPSRVRVNDKDSSALALLDEGFLFLRLSRGRHAVRLEGPLPSPDALTLAFVEVPRSVRVDAEGWEVEGVRSDGKASNSIRLRRIMASPGGNDRERTRLPSWFVVRRRLDIGVRWSVETSIERLTPAGSPAVLRIPLLPGESVTESEALIKDKELVVSLGSDDASFSWTSVLEPTKVLDLKASKGVRWSEQWTLACTPLWRCRARGLDPVRHQIEGRSESVFKPWPGEKLRLRFERPPPAPGGSSTIDRVTLALTPGVRILNASLKLRVRTSAGGAQVLHLPEEARVQSLEIDGETRPLQQVEGAVALTLRPGSQQITLAWHQPARMATWFETPAIDLGGEAVNARVEVEVPRDRWLLYTTGPDWGVAILFWPYLLLVLILAFALSRATQTPLGLVQWMLLGLGLTQIPAWAALIVVGWFYALSQRSTSTDVRPLWFNLRQLALVGFTLIALGCLYAAVHTGLLLQPDMQIAGSDPHLLRWYVDRVDGSMPRPAVVSVPLWVYRLGMLLWALWLAWRLLHWSRWAWRCFSEGGLWRKLRQPLRRSPTPPGGPRASTPPPAPSRGEGRTSHTPPAPEAPRGERSSTAPASAADSAKPAASVPNETEASASDEPVPEPDKTAPSEPSEPAATASAEESPETEKKADTPSGADAPSDGVKREEDPKKKG